MITAKLKDDILFDLTSYQKISIELSISKKSESFNIQKDMYCAIIEHFSRKGFLRINTETSSTYIIELSIDIFDYANRGGFTAQEMILKANIEKLSLEIDNLFKNLSKDSLEIASKIASIGGTILSAIDLMS